MPEGDIGLDCVRFAAQQRGIKQMQKSGPGLEMLIFPAAAVNPFVFGLGDGIQQRVEPSGPHITRAFLKEQAAGGFKGAHQRIEHITGSNRIKRI